jgi:prepilin-type N-terminal cleavage/methylation domain-containing protein
MTRSGHRSRPGGFTLLEVLIAMSLLALVAGICYAAFHLGTRAVVKGEEAVVTAQRLRVATDVLIRQVKSMVPQGAVGQDGDRTTTYSFFSGTTSSMEFVTEAGQLSGGGRARVRYEVDQDPPRLVLTETPYFDAVSLSKGIDPEAQSATVLDGFRTLTFEFFWLEDVSEPERSSSHNYEDHEVLPQAVIVHIAGVNGLDEDVEQWIPVMSAGRGDAEAEPLEDQDCETFDGDAGEDEPDENNPRPGRRNATPEATDE